MKKLVLLVLICTLLTACTPGGKPAETTVPAGTLAPETTAPVPVETLPPETTEPLTTITVFSPNETFDGYIQTQVQGHQLTVLEALMQMEVLPAGVQVNEIAWDLEEKHICVDFNAAFRDLICSQGTTGELMILGSVVNTFLTANEAELMTITIDGEAWESGHEVYDHPLGFYE